MGTWWTVASRLRFLAGPGVTFVYPLYASVKALESPSKEDDQQWLTYWIIYSFIVLLEMGAAPFFSWILPIWQPLKVGFIAWLVLPQFRGAAFIYHRVVRRLLIKYREALDNYKRKAKPKSEGDSKEVHNTKE